VIGVAANLCRLSRTVPSCPAGDLDDQQMLAKAAGPSRWSLTVVDTDRLAAHMLRLKMSAPGLGAMEWQPAQDFTLLIMRAAGRDIRRRYTIAGQNHNTITFDVYSNSARQTVWSGEK
jgi:NADPH-dependent ferric siderophore reductase